MRLIHGFATLSLATMITAAPQGDEFVITVGKSGGLTQHELDVYAKRGARELGKRVTTLSDAEREQFRKRAIDEEVLFQAAIAAGGLKTANMRRRLIATYKSSQTSAKISPNRFTDAEIKTHYDAHKQDFVQPVEIKFGVLVFPKGTPRAEMQKKMSMAMRTPGKVKGWKKTRWTEPGERFGTPLSSQQTKQLFTLKKGRVSRLLRDSYGTQYLFWARDRRESKQVPLSQCRAKVVHHMITAKQGKLGSALNKKLRAAGGRGKSDEDLQYSAAIAANAHRVWHTRQRVINTYVHDAKKTRDQLLPGLRRRFRVATPPR